MKLKIMKVIVSAFSALMIAQAFNLSTPSAAAIITIPSEIYENKEMVEFINNPDGSISVLIKNIESILNKFNA